MLPRTVFWLVTAGALSLNASNAFPLTVEQLAADGDDCKDSDSCRDGTAALSTLSQHSPPQFAALLQKQFKTNNSIESLVEQLESLASAKIDKADKTKIDKADKTATNSLVSILGHRLTSSLNFHSKGKTYNSAKVHSTGAVEKAAKGQSEAQKSSSARSGTTMKKTDYFSNSRYHHRQPAPAESRLFRWGSPPNEHPSTIGKSAPHPRVQDYEAHLAPLTGMVLNIFVNSSSGAGGLLLALEVPSPCAAAAGTWVEVDRARCSSRYPCALRLPGTAIRGDAAAPTKFRTVVVVEDQDYFTDFIEYKKVTLDLDAEVAVARAKFVDAEPRRIVKFNLSPAMAAGALYVMPVVTDAAADCTVTMRLRQANVAASSLLDTGARRLETSLQNYRAPWAGEWRSPVKAIAGCDFSFFEVVAEQLYPGEVELEVWTASGGSTTISDIVVTSRVSWSEAEVALLDTVLKDHFAYFNDPEVIIHGLPNGALKKDQPGRLGVSNPTEWGYAMQSWVIMAQTGHITTTEVVAKLQQAFNTMKALQADPTQFTHGMFYPYYKMRTETGEKQFPARTDYTELPCGDDALLYASLVVVEGFLRGNKYIAEAETCAQIRGRFDFTQCLHVTDCNGPTNGQKAAGVQGGDQFWSIPLTVNANTLEKNSYNWNVWADEGGLVAMIVAMTGAVTAEQYESLVRQQQRYSPCQSWEGVSVGHAAFFNSVFTLPTRSMLGFGTLFSSPYLHEFAVRTVLPTFRAHQKLKKKLGIDYMGASDAMTQGANSNPDRVYGSYAYWPPNNMYDCRRGKSMMENQCTWCAGNQIEGIKDPVDKVVPHGNTAAFLVAAMMEQSLFKAWLEDTKLLMTDASGIYAPGYGFEVMAPARRTPPGGTYIGAAAGRGIWESLSHGYTILSMYEGLATMSRRYELVKAEGLVPPGSYEPPKYLPISDFVDVFPQVRTKIDELLGIARAQESQEKKCTPSDYGPAGQY